MTWMNLPEEYSGKESKFWILPIEYEGEVSFEKGSAKGSQEIVRASFQLEYYDEINESEPFRQGIHLLSAKTPDPAKHVNVIKAEVERINPVNKFLLVLGGDHSITIGLVQGFENFHEDFSVIVLDAHADFRQDWQGSQNNHACVCKQLSKKHSLAILGLRSLDIDEHEELKIQKENGQVDFLFANECGEDKIESVLGKLKRKVYLSIDADAFDPSIIRNTGTPEPSGFNWDQLLNILQKIFARKEVIGCDIVEFCPAGNENDVRVEAYTLAKLVYKIISMKENQN